jgi:hypothetical protein
MGLCLLSRVKVQSHWSFGAGPSIRWEPRTSPGSSLCPEHEESHAGAQLGTQLNHAGRGRRNSSKALALASSRRHRKSGKPRTPPMAYVEEITLDEAMQSYPSSLFSQSQTIGILPLILALTTRFRLRETAWLTVQLARQRNSPPAMLRKRHRPAQKEKMTHPLVHLWRRRLSRTTSRYIKSVKQ